MCHYCFSTVAQVADSLTGVTVKDVDTVFSKTRHTTCISPSLGGSGNPSVITARGIVCAIKVPAPSLLLYALHLACFIPAYDAA